MTAAIAQAMEQQTQTLLVETQLDITEFDNLLQPIIDTCTKDAISVRLCVTKTRVHVARSEDLIERNLFLFFGLY